MNNIETSIIIRTRNEERWLGRVLDMVFAQTYQNFDVVVVDSGSTDKTLEIASRYPVKVVQIKPGEFTYPYAINLGIRNSLGEKYIVILSAHSLPVSNTWLEKGLKHFRDEKVCGVYGPLKGLPDGTFWDKFFHGLSYIRENLVCLPKKFRIVTTPGFGVLGFTNAIIRRDLWSQYNLNEQYGNGGEDDEWARYWLSKNFYIIKDVGFTVHHSHYLNLSEWKEQRRYWASLYIPQPFKYLDFRKDGAHKKD